MTKDAANASDPEKTPARASGLRVIQQWLDSPPAANAIDEFASLRSHLKCLRDAGGALPQRARVLDRLYSRSMAAIRLLRPTLEDAGLPLPAKTRRIVRSAQDLLQMLADDTLLMRDELIRGTTQPPGATLATALWQGVNALKEQLLISHLIASPTRPGAWQQLHQLYALAQTEEADTGTVRGTGLTLQHLYRGAVLLGCAQPASLTAREVAFLATLLDRLADRVEPIEAASAVAPGTFWIDPERDVPAISCVRKVAPPSTPVEAFSCARVIDETMELRARIDAGTNPAELGLPEFAASPAGLGVLRRLANRWSGSGKRRYQRRRQNYRTVLAAGLDNIWLLSCKEEAPAVDLSTWMITNESPDGYAVMHVSGKTGRLTVGDIVALRAGSDQHWQVCLIRWATSENPEHLELGLQILAPRATPATLVQPSRDGGPSHVRVLILPELPSLRASQLLVAATGSLARDQQRLLLIVEEGNLAVREVTSTEIDEQTASIETRPIKPDENPF